MVFQLPDKYIDLLTDFGFKRVFGSEANKSLLIDFLNTLLPKHHHIQSLVFKNTEKPGNTAIDRKAIFDLYCQTDGGQRIIIEVQKAKQNFFKDRSVYYATFPIQEQAKQGDWSFELDAVYTVGILDFVFSDRKHDETLLYTVELKDQNCDIFYKKLKFIYIELPKFKKQLDQLESNFDKWLYLLKNLARLNEPPQQLQGPVFEELFTVAKIANFSPIEQDRYQNSLKYYRDFNNVVDTAWQEGMDRGIEQGIEQEQQRLLQRQRSLIIRQLSRSLGDVSDEVEILINELPLERLEALGEALFDFSNLDDVLTWLRDMG